MTGVLFLVQFNNFNQTIGFYIGVTCSYSSCLLLHALAIVHVISCVHVWGKSGQLAFAWTYSISFMHTCMSHPTRFLVVLCTRLTTTTTDTAWKNDSFVECVQRETSCTCAHTKTCVCKLLLRATKNLVHVYEQLFVCKYVRFETGWNLLPVLYKNSNMYCTAVSRHRWLLLSMWPMFYFWYSSLISTGPWPSIGVTRSCSSRPFLYTLAIVHVISCVHVYEQLRVYVCTNPLYYGVKPKAY